MNLFYLHFSDTILSDFDLRILNTKYDISNDPEKEELENTVGKGEMLVTSIFSFSRNVFYPIKD